MKQFTVLCLGLLPFISTAYSQRVYNVIDIHSIQKGPESAIARDGLGRTVSFYLTPLPVKMAIGKSLQHAPPLIKMGSVMTVDLANATISPISDTLVKYAILQPTSSRGIGTVSLVFPMLVSMSGDLAAKVGVKLTSGKGAGFDVDPYSPAEENFFNKPVYENYYNGKRFAVLIPSKEEEKNKIVITYELHDWDVPNSMDSINNSDTSEEQVQKLMSKRPWDIQADPDLKGIGGEVTMDLPKGISYSTHLLFYTPGDSKKAVASWFGNNKTKLPAGLYNIVVDGKYTIHQVPVEEGKQTRLKMGFLGVSSYGPVTIEDSYHQKFTYAAPFTILLPEGNYLITGKKNSMIVIKDGVKKEM